MNVGIEKGKLLTRTALLIALTVLFQSLRFVIPLPTYLSAFIVGSLVNTTLLVAAEILGLWSALVIAVVAPIIAYFQQHLPLPVFIIPVALGNAVYVGLYTLGLRWGRFQGIVLAAFGKTGFLYSIFSWMLTVILLHPKIAAGLMLAMSWPQFITAVAGGILASIVNKRLKRVIGEIKLEFLK